MSARVLPTRSPRASVAGFVFSIATLSLSFVACGGEDEDDDGLFSESGGSAGNAGAGVSAAGGSTAGRGGSSSGSAGSAARGGSASGNGATGGGAGKGGSSAGLAGTGGGAGSTSGSGGSTSGEAGDGAGGTSSGKGGRPPSDGGSGGSPYEIECHGDTVECGDPESLLCLGIRVGEEVFGYSCSNECETNADCSDAPASADSSAECVDFVTTSYCLLVCQNGDTTTSCPDGTYCYVYPGSPIGYCLWQ